MLLARSPVFNFSRYEVYPARRHGARRKRRRAGTSEVAAMPVQRFHTEGAGQPTSDVGMNRARSRRVAGASAIRRVRRRRRSSRHRARRRPAPLRVFAGHAPAARGQRRQRRTRGRHRDRGPARPTWPSFSPAPARARRRRWRSSRSCCTHVDAADRRGRVRHRRQPARRRARQTLISPDIATCDDCLRELFDPDRSPLPVSVHQLHQLRPALHHRARRAVRPAVHHHGGRSRMCADVRARVSRPARPPLPCPADLLPGMRAAAAAASIATVRRSRRPDRDGGAAALRAGRVVAVKGLGGYHLAAAGGACIARRRRPAQPQASRGSALRRDGARSRRGAPARRDRSPSRRDLLSSPRRPIVLLRAPRRRPLADARGAGQPFRRHHAPVYAAASPALPFVSPSRSC